MKIFFVLIILANIFVALWEYRYGTTYAPEAPSSSELVITGQEQIKLKSEIGAAEQQPPDTNKPTEAAQPGSGTQ